jgi:GTPase SAR1 family protein
MFFECSAKSGIGVDEVFHNSAKSISDKIEKNQYDLLSSTSGIKMGIGAKELKEQSKISLTNSKKKKDKTSGCC